MIMVISKLTNNNIAYYCLHAEVTYLNSKVGVPVSIDSASAIVLKSVIDPICQDIINDTDNLAFVLDFDGIENIQVNAVVEGISNLCNIHNKKIVLANIKESIIKFFTFDVTKHMKQVVPKNEGCYAFCSLCEIDCNKMSNCEEVFALSVPDKLKKYVKEEVMEHHSSSVYLTSYIDIKQLITLDKSFVLYCIYRLAKKIWINWINEAERKDSIKSKEKPILICQSLNGSFIASVLSSLLDLDIFIIDSIGPVNKLYRSLGAIINPGKKYIVVSDVVCLGTEVKITKNIIEYLGGIYYGNVSIVRVASIKKYNNIETVFTIDKNNNKEFNYRIITSLDQ